MLTKILRMLGHRRRASTHLTARYEERRRREIRAALERFQEGQTA